MAELRIDRVTKSFGRETPAVRDVSLAVPDGEILTVLGPSGCGKSTLLRLVAGLEKADSGDISIGGRRVNDLEPKDRDIAMVFQSYALYPHMTVFDNIAASLKLRGVPRDEIRSRVEESAGKLGIQSHLRRYPRELSGGERQRVALARTLVRKPHVFLLDEPLSNLDAQLRERTRGELKSLFKQLRATVVYVTHDQVEATTLSDRVAVMREGRIEQLGTPDEIYRRPATRFVAEFVGSPSINIVPEKDQCMAVRPEDVVLDPAGPHELQVVLRESLGAQQLLTLKSESMQLRALVPAAWAPVDRVRVRFEVVHRFDREGRRV
jgi:ABC-type sugar transport system ATPase subunit